MGADEEAPDAVDGGELAWMSTKASADYLGITPRTLYRFIDEGQVPAYKMGRVIRLKRADLDGFIEANRVQPGELSNLYPPRKAGPGGVTKRQRGCSTREMLHHTSASGHMTTDPTAHAMAIHVGRPNSDDLRRLVRQIRRAASASAVQTATARARLPTFHVTYGDPDVAT